MSYIEQYSEMFVKQGTRFELLNGQLFMRRGLGISALGPVSQAYQLDEKQCQMLLRKLGGFWVMRTDGLESNVSNSNWYAVVCKKHTRVENVPSGNTRSKIRRGLKNCQVRKVDAEEIASHGYETYCAALRGYHNSSLYIPSKEEFQIRERMDAPFGDIRHQWAVYHDGKLIAFTHNLIYNKIEVDYTMIKLHPDYLNRYSSYALIYKMNEYYLEKKGFKYANDGFRSISHNTGVQGFLIREFGFEKAYTRLRVYFRFPCRWLLRGTRPLRKLITFVCPKAKAIYELDRLSSDQEK